MVSYCVRAVKVIVLTAPLHPTLILQLHAVVTAIYLLFICLSIRLFFVYLFIYLFIYLSKHFTLFSSMS